MILESLTIDMQCPLSNSVLVPKVHVLTVPWRTCTVQVRRALSRCQSIEWLSVQANYAEPHRPMSPRVISTVTAQLQSFRNWEPVLQIPGLGKNSRTSVQ